MSQLVRTLVHALEAFLGHDLLEAVERALVDAVSDLLLRLKHHATTNGVEGLQWRVMCRENYYFRSGISRS